MKLFKYSVFIILLIITSCISFEIAQSTKYDKHIKFKKNDYSFDKVTETLKIMLADPDYVYSKKNTSWSIDKFPKDIAQRKTGITLIDKKSFIVEGTGLIFVKYGLVPGKTLYDIKIIICNDEIIFSFYNIANLGGYLQYKRDMDIFIEVADKMILKFISEVK